MSINDPDRGASALNRPETDESESSEDSSYGHGAISPEQREREAAFARARRRPAPTEERTEDRDFETGRASPDVAHSAFAALAENVRDYAIFLLNADGVITLWGEGARLIKWWTKEEAEGSHLRMLYPDGGSEDGTAEAHLDEAVERGEYIGEGHRVRRDGSLFWAGVSLTCLRDAQGQLLGFAKVTRDLTSRRAEEASLRAAREAAEEARTAAEEANRAKSQFLATMSHEIRTPINAVMGYVDLMEMELAGPLSEQQRAYLDRVRTSNMHLLGIIDEVLDFSRLEADRISVSQGVGRLAPPLRAAIQMIQTQAQGKGLHVADSISGSAADLAYSGDEDRVRQILVVLLSNAVKFTPRGGRVTVSAGMADEPPSDAQLTGHSPWIYVRVEDTGPGIPPERTQAIFDPFEQADMSLTRPHGGTGLGLTIARRLATLMGGDLTVRSHPGMGSAFFLWLPAAEEAELERTMLSGDGSVGPKLLDEVRDAVLMELERILHVFVGRLRTDAGTPSAANLSEAELEDHLATFLSDLADTFRAVHPDEGVDRQTLEDGTAIQRTVAERHGAQRRRLGWSEAEVRREYQILQEEVASAIQRRVLDRDLHDLQEVLNAVGAFIEAAERMSLEQYRASP